MRMRTALLAAALAVAGAARAQPADPIGALLELNRQAGPEPEAALPSAPIPYSAATRPQALPPRAAEPPSGPEHAPPRLEETGRTPDTRPPSALDLAYESRMRASFASAQSFQGAMDGGWSLQDIQGAALYDFQFADRGRGVVEGAWRDLRLAGGPEASGFVEEIQRSPTGLTLRFTPASGVGTAVATLQGGYGGEWSGQFVEQGLRRAVTLKRKPR